VSVTYWNGEPTPCTRVVVLVADAPEIPLYWARDLVGHERNAVRIDYAGQRFYIDDEAIDDGVDRVTEIKLRDGVTRTLTTPAGRDGWGWQKVTTGRGSPNYPHRSLWIERELRTREATG
jgi:hypothetical protein